MSMLNRRAAIICACFIVPAAGLPDDLIPTDRDPVLYPTYRAVIVKKLSDYIEFWYGTLVGGAKLPKDRIIAKTLGSGLAPVIVGGFYRAGEAAQLMSPVTILKVSVSDVANATVASATRTSIRSMSK